MQVGAWQATQQERACACGVLGMLGLWGGPQESSGVAYRWAAGLQESC
jgi:hypothetical protein